MLPEVEDSRVRLSVIADDGNLCGECPVWHPDEQTLYWTDAGSGRLYRYKWPDGGRELILHNFDVNGFALDESGGLVLVNNEGVWFWNQADPPSLVAREINGRKLRLNDCVAGPDGTLLAGSCFYDSSVDYELGCLFSIRPDGTGEILDSGFHLANGLGFSPDLQTLYFNDSVARRVYRYHYEPEHARVAQRRLFAELDKSAGLPDGLTVDAEGFVWWAEWYGSRLTRFDPTGILERRIAIPAKQTSSLAFGGADFKDVFVTSAAKSEPMPVMPPGYDSESGYFGGKLFCFNVGIAGKPEYKTRFKR
jgi:D-xylonolactonase